MGRRSVIDACNFGARGDDLDDDTIAIQAAIEAAIPDPGSTVRIGAGTFLLKERFAGAGAALTILGAQGLSIVGQGSKATRLLLTGYADAHILSVEQSSGVSISGLNLYGDRRTHRVGHGIRVADSNAVTLSRVVIEAAAHYGIGLQRGVLRDIQIRDVDIVDTGGDGIDVKNETGRNWGLVVERVSVRYPGQVAEKQAGIDVRGVAKLRGIEIIGLPKGASGIRFRADGLRTGPGGHYSSLAGFRIAGAYGAIGLEIVADHVDVREGSITDADTGVLAMGRAAQISNVIVSGAQRYAFRIALSAVGTDVDSCRGASSRAGIWIEGRESTVSRSEWSFNSWCGLCVRPEAGAYHLVDNVLEGNGAPP